eukprot:3735015-Pyramimonas_sp.AAC.1
MGNQSTTSPGQHVFLQAGQQIDHIHIPPEDGQTDRLLPGKQEVVANSQGLRVELRDRHGI